MFLSRRVCSWMMRTAAPGTTPPWASRTTPLSCPVSNCAWTGPASRRAATASEARRMDRSALGYGEVGMSSLLSRGGPRRSAVGGHTSGAAHQRCSRETPPVLVGSLPRPDTNDSLDRIVDLKLIRISQSFKTLLQEKCAIGIQPRASPPGARGPRGGTDGPAEGVGGAGRECLDVDVFWGRRGNRKVRTNPARGPAG